jgi:hypothetical protein
VKLNLLVVAVGPPLDLQRAVIAREIIREFELFALEGGLLAPAREGAQVVRAAVRGVEDFEVVLVRAKTNTDGTVAMGGWGEDSPANEVS